MFAIYKRELKSYFHSFIGFLFIAVTLLGIGLYFSTYNLFDGYPYFSYAVSSCTILCLITVPVLTMRSLAEERKSKSDQLILTAPVSVGGIVMGKFLALVTIFAIPMVISCTYPLILQSYGPTPLLENYIAILGFFLYGATAIAIGLLISSLTESQVIAAVLSFVVLFFGQMMDYIAGIFVGSGNIITKILMYLDISAPFMEMINGTLNLGSFVYYVSVIALLLFLTTQSIQKRRYSVSVKNLSLGAYSAGMIAVAVAIVVILNFIVGELPEGWKNVDLTANKLYSLTETSKEFVKNMQEDVDIYVLASEENTDDMIRHTLQEFDELSDHITVEYVDPAINPQFYTKYTDAYVTTGSLIVSGAERNRVILYSKMYDVVYSSDYSSSTVTGYDGEGRILSALDYVTAEYMPKIYMTEDHEELPLDTSYIDSLEKENIGYEYISLTDYDAVPEDATCLFINAAIKDFSAEEAEKVIRYLDNGGRVVLVLGYTDEALPNLESVAAYMGISVVEGLVLELSEEYYYNIPYYLLPARKECDYTEEVFRSSYIFAPYAKGMLIENEEAEGLKFETFLYTTGQSFSKVNLENIQDYEKKEGDIDGPFAIAVEAVKSLGDGEAMMVAIGSEQLFSEDADNVVNGANLKVFSNMMSKLVGRESTISIASKSFDTGYVLVDMYTAVMISALVTFILPMICVVTGFVIWFRRRKR